MSSVSFRLQGNITRRLGLGYGLAVRISLRGRFDAISMRTCKYRTHQWPHDKEREITFCRSIQAWIHLALKVRMTESLLLP